MEQEGTPVEKNALDEVINEAEEFKGQEQMQIQREEDTTVDETEQIIMTLSKILQQFSTKLQE